MANMASACALVVSEEKGFDPIRSWTTKSAATTCALVSISVVSICAMVVCGVVIVREYSLSAAYKKSHCWVEDVSFMEDKICNYCPGHKTKEKNSASCVQSKFPCVQVSVAHEIDGVRREGLLHSDSIEASGFFSQCSHHVCMKDFDESKKAVDQYAEKWKVLRARYLYPGAGDLTTGRNRFIVEQVVRYFYDTKPSTNDSEPSLRQRNESSLNSSDAELLKMRRTDNGTKHTYEPKDGYFVCFVNEAEPHDVIEHKKYTKYDVIHCMFWPALVVFCCCCLFLYIEARRRRLTLCGRRDQPRDTSKLFVGRGFLPRSKVTVLDRSHFVARGLEEHVTKSDPNKHRNSEAFVKKACPSKCRLLSDEEGKRSSVEEGRTRNSQPSACRDRRSEIDTKASKHSGGPMV